MEFPELLQTLRERAGLSQLRYATESGTTRGQVSNMELGTRTPNLKELPALAAPLNLSEAEREQFVFLAAAAHIPDATARMHVISVFDRQSDAESRYNAVLKRLAAMEAALDTMPATL